MFSPATITAQSVPSSLPSAPQTSHPAEPTTNTAAAAATDAARKPAKLPPAILCVGMAGSGKTTFTQRVNAHLHAMYEPPYTMNLDPAVRSVPFQVNIDIRDSINYKEVMSQYNLGPNGGIMTSLNLFATKIDQVIDILDKRSKADKPITRILVDTPGQIECFVWSASGAIITDAMASTFPTVIAYILDTPRTASPATFMANMLYACSILYKTKLPMVLVFNKTDAHSAGFAREWMTDFEAFQTALRESEDGNEESIGGSGYMTSLLNSMSLMLDEFYNHLDVVSVSAMTGAGIDEFLQAVDKKVAEYEQDYRPEMEKMRERREATKAANKQQELEKLIKDMEMEGAGNLPSKKKGSAKEKPAVLSDVESDDEDEPLYGDDSDEEVVPNDPDHDNNLRKRYEQALKERNVEGMQDEEDATRLQDYMRRQL